MTASDLKHLYQTAEPDGHFFDRKTMRFFGDTMRNYGVRRAAVRNLYTPEGEPNEPRPAWELYRRRPVKHGLASSRYFAEDGRELAAVEEVPLSLIA